MVEVFCQKPSTIEELKEIIEELARELSGAGMRKRWVLVPLPPLALPHFHFRFHKNVAISLVAIPPTNVEAVGLAFRFRFCFCIPGQEKIFVESW